MNSLETRKLVASYGKKAIIDGLDIEIVKGKITIIIGPNGCGKSTALKSMAKLLKPFGGEVLLNGRDIAGLSAKETAREMAVLPQSPQAPQGLTVGELVAYGRFSHQKVGGRITADDRKIIDWSLEATGLCGLEDTQLFSLSGGQRQRVWIAMALAQQTDLILLDEPTTYLDMAYQLEVLELLQRLNREQNRTIVMVLHDLNLAARFADCMIAMRGGKIVKAGSVTEVMTPEVLRQVFSINATVLPSPDGGFPACVSYQLIKGER